MNQGRIQHDARLRHRTVAGSQMRPTLALVFAPLMRRVASRALCFGCPPRDALPKPPLASLVNYSVRCSLPSVGRACVPAWVPRPTPAAPVFASLRGCVGRGIAPLLGARAGPLPPRALCLRRSVASLGRAPVPSAHLRFGPCGAALGHALPACACSPPVPSSCGVSACCARARRAASRCGVGARAASPPRLKCQRHPTAIFRRQSSRTSRSNRNRNSNRNRKNNTCPPIAIMRGSSRALHVASPLAHAKPLRGFAQASP